MCTAMHTLLVSKNSMLSSRCRRFSINMHRANAGLSSHTSQDKFMNAVNKLARAFPVIPGSIPRSSRRLLCEPVRLDSSTLDVFRH